MTAPDIQSIVSTRLLERTSTGKDIVTVYRHIGIDADGIRWELVESWQYAIATVHSWRRI